MYCLLFGWWLAVVHFLVAAPVWLVSEHYARLSWELGKYFFWPFGRYIMRRRDLPAAAVAAPLGERQPLMSAANPSPDANSTADGAGEAGGAFPAAECTGTAHPCAFAIWCLFLPPLLLAHGLALFFCGFLVVLMPMAKVHWLVLSSLIWYDPSTIIFADSTVHHGPTTGAEVVICAYEAINFFYYKYEGEGVGGGREGGGWFER